MTSLFYWLFGPKEPTKDEAIHKHTKFFIERGVWFCYIRSDINSDYMRKYLILYMKDKNFQAISTGPFSVTFQQDISNRKCAAAFNVVKSKKRVKFEYYEGNTIDPNSATSIFFQSILLELASKMADKNMLYEQKYKELEPLPTSLSSIADENTFINPAKRFWVAFLRPESTSIARKVILHYFNRSRFCIDGGSDKSRLYLSNYELYLTITVIIGQNGKNELLAHVFFSSLPKPEEEEDDDDEDDEEDEEDDENQKNSVLPEKNNILHRNSISSPPSSSSSTKIEVKDTGDPDLRQGDREYFHCLLLGLGRHLAQHELLRTQTEEFNKRTNDSGKSTSKDIDHSKTTKKHLKNKTEKDEKEDDNGKNEDDNEKNQIKDSTITNDGSSITNYSIDDESQSIDYSDSTTTDVELNSYSKLDLDKYLIKDTNVILPPTEVTNQ